MHGRKLWRYALAVVAVCALAVFLANTNLLAPAASGRPEIIAHRGLGQTFHREGLTGETCTAERIFPPEHPYLENTIASFRAAFDAGADMVELDVHPTTDGHFVVFHDWTLDCRTDGTGVTREHDLATLKALDIGYGYTADGGQTYLFRGKGIGLMPTLAEVLDAFPNERFLINVKSDDPSEGSRLVAKLAGLSREQRNRLAVYGGGRALDEIASALPDLRVMPTDGAKACLLRYLLFGWSGHVPQPCRHSFFMLPANFAPYAWGYPNRLAARLRANDTTLVVLGDYDGSGYSSGVDDVETLRRLPAHFDGAIWTNRIDIIGPAVTGIAGHRLRLRPARRGGR